MAMSTGRRVAIAVAGIVLVLVVVALGGLYFAQYEVKQRVIAALGPLGSAESIDVGLTSVRLTHVRLKAPPGWPAADALSADQITLIPDVRELSPEPSAYPFGRGERLRSFGGARGGWHPQSATQSQGIAEPSGWRRERRRARRCRKTNASITSRSSKAPSSSTTTPCASRRTRSLSPTPTRASTICICPRSPSRPRSPSMAPSSVRRIRARCRSAAGSRSPARIRRPPARCAASTW